MVGGRRVAASSSLARLMLIFKIEIRIFSTETHNNCAQFIFVCLHLWLFLIYKCARRRRARWLLSCGYNLNFRFILSYLIGYATHLRIMKMFDDDEERLIVSEIKGIQSMQNKYMCTASTHTHSSYNQSLIIELSNHRTDYMELLNARARFATPRSLKSMSSTRRARGRDYMQMRCWGIIKSNAHLQMQLNFYS